MDARLSRVVSSGRVNDSARKRTPFVIALLALAACRPPAGNATLTVDALAAGHRISPLLFGDQVETIDDEAFWDPVARAPIPGVLSLAQEAGITILRYPGGTPSDFFHWEQTIGPAEGRTDQIDPFTSTVGAEVRKAVRYGPDEFAAAAQSLGAEMLVTANAGTGTPDEAARWLQHYRDAGVDARYWEIGNEIWIGGDTFGASIPRKTPEEYAALFDQFARALRAVDPAVKVGILGCHDSGAFALCDQADWNARVFAAATERFDFIAIHNSYAPAFGGPFSTGDSERVFRAMLAAPEYIQQNFALQEQDLDQFAAPQSRLAPFAITEHASLFIPSPDATIGKAVERNRTLASALFSAASFNLFLADPRIGMAEHLKLASPYWQAPVSTSPLAPAQAPLRSAYLYVVRTYAEAAGGSFVPVTVSCDATFDSEAVGLVPAQEGVSALHAAAVVPPSGPDALWIYVVNRDLERDVRGTLEVQNLAVQAVSADVLGGPAYWAANGIDSPDAVTMTTLELGGATALTFPAHSLTRVRIR